MSAQRGQRCWLFPHELSVTTCLMTKKYSLSNDGMNKWVSKWRIWKKYFFKLTETAFLFVKRK
jgi:hypothetical protein